MASAEPTPKAGWEVKSLEDWLQASIEDVCIIEYGTRITRKNDAGSLYPVYGGGGETFRTDSFNREDRVVIARFGMSENCTRLVKGKFFLNDSGITLSPKENNVFHARFLEYLVFSLNDIIFDLGRGTAQKNLDVDAFRCLQIEYPKSLAEQERIVGILDEAFEGIAAATAQAEKNLHNARELFQAVLINSVSGQLTELWRSKNKCESGLAEKDLTETLERIKSTQRKRGRKADRTVGHEVIASAIPSEWLLTDIESLFEIIDYRGKNPPKAESGKRLVTAKNIKMGYLAEEPVTFISPETYKKWMVRGFPKPNDILFVTEGHTMGFVALNTRTDEFALAQRTITLQPAVCFSSKFFFYYMLSPFFQELVRTNATGAAAKGLKGAKLRSLPLPFPPLCEQQAIVEKLDALSEETKRLEAIYERKQAALAELKQSLLQKAFAGEL